MDNTSDFEQQMSISVNEKHLNLNSNQTAETYP